MEETSGGERIGHRTLIGITLAGVALASALVVVLAPHAVRPGVLGVVLAVSMVASFALQLATADRIGFVTRLSITAVGAFAIVLVAALIGLLV